MCHIFLCSILAGVQEDRSSAFHSYIPGASSGKEAGNDEEECYFSQDFREKGYWNDPQLPC